MERLTRADELQRSVSHEVIELIEQFKAQVLSLKALYEKIHLKCYKEGLNDHDIWLLLKHTSAKLDINNRQKMQILSMFRPTKEPVYIPEAPALEKRQSSMESYEGNFEFFFPFSVIDKNVAIAKQKLMGMIRVAEDGFYLK